MASGQKAESCETFKKGAIVVFYISGHAGGPQQATFAARITSSAVIPVRQAFVQYNRQGVLGEEDLFAISSNGLIHVVTFDTRPSYFRGSPVTANFSNSSKETTGAFR